MINLLPPQKREYIKYSRVNAALRKWIAGAVLATIGLVIIFVLGWLYINQQSNKLSNHIAAGQKELKEQKYEQVKKDAKQISGNVRLISQVLSREIDFSGLIQETGTVMPPGTVLSSLMLSKIDGAIDLSVDTKDHASAAQVAVNLSDPKNNIFEKVDIIKINCTASTDPYPCNGSFKALFNKKVPSRFLLVQEGAKQ